nr:growth-regulating factor 1-like [Tanacetum cinerariifolium]
MDFLMTTFGNNTTPTLLKKHDDDDEKHNNSGSIKQHRSDDHQHFVLPTFKSSRTDYFDQPNKTTMSMRSDPMLSVSAPDTNNMLSFSSNDTAKDANQTSLFSFYQPPNAYIRNTGYGSGGIQTGMNIPISRYKGPFTPSQWMELEHQALIYKHFVANVPVPAHLLNPLRNSLNTFLFPGSSSAASHAPNSYGWGSFQLGTDGKKWRCSRDAVPDQKYCERHINRGRHRSRKPVESQNGHALSGPTTPKVGPVISSSTIPISNTRASATVIANANVHNQFKTRDIPINRTQELQAFAINTSSDSFMYPTNYNSVLDHGAPNSNPVPHYVDGWTKDQSLKPDWTQLSMSIPVAASDFSSSSNSPAQEKLAVPPLSLTTEFELELAHKQASNWIPISWGNTMGGGGPLGEVLNRTSSSSGIKSKDASLGSEMWDAVNYHMGSSPTGVLQKTTFVSLSNSSSGSSHKGNKTDEHGGFCDELLLSTLAS